MILSSLKIRMLRDFETLKKNQIYSVKFETDKFYIVVNDEVYIHVLKENAEVIENDIYDIAREEIISKRTDEEIRILKTPYISLPDEEQKICDEIKRREELEYAKIIGFEVGSHVINIKTNEIFIVRNIWDVGGTLRIEKMQILLTDGNPKFWLSIYDRESAIKQHLNGLTEDNYIDNYIRYENKDTETLENGQIRFLV